MITEIQTRSGMRISQFGGKITRKKVRLGRITDNNNVG
jgi:hypothetical protein